jgi:hypothetical protein
MFVDVMSKFYRSLREKVKEAEENKYCPRGRHTPALVCLAGGGGANLFDSYQNFIIFHSCILVPTPPPLKKKSAPGFGE